MRARTSLAVAAFSLFLLIGDSRAVSIEESSALTLESDYVVVRYRQRDWVD